ncbi:MAG: MaoC family dehydratase [Dehalococcoidia bacterium]|nr:MaoC family dehydratase [Dehalococcoidia bacterium]
MPDNRTVTTIDELKTLTGQTLGHGAWFEITQERVDAFAEVTGDHQWIHVDAERAAAAPFGGTIAHGYLTLSIQSLLNRDWEGPRIDLGQTMTINYGLNRVRFITPVRVGKRIRMHNKLLGVQDVSPGIHHIVMEHTVEIEDGARPAMVAESIRRVLL